MSKPATIADMKKTNPILQDLANAQRVEVSTKMGINGLPYMDFWVNSALPCFGKRIFFAGQEGSGKSTTMYSILIAISQTCKQCWTRAMDFYDKSYDHISYTCRCGKNDFQNVMLCDLENSATPNYLNLLGAELTGKQFITEDKKFNFYESNGRGGVFFLMPTGSGEDIYESTVSYMKMGVVDAFAIDSLNGMLPKENLVENKNRIGKKAQMHWEGLKKLLHSQGEYVNKLQRPPTVLFTNHLINNIGNMYNPREEAGGGGPKIHADQTYRMSPMDINAKSAKGKEVPGYTPTPQDPTYFNRIKFTVAKNKWSGIVRGTGYFDVWMRDAVFKTKDNAWRYTPGMSNEHHKLFEFMNSYNLIESTSKGYRFLGQDFKNQNAIRVSLMDPVKQMWCRYIIGKTLFSELASNFLDPNDYFYGPIDDDLAETILSEARIAKGSHEKTTLHTDKSAEYFLDNQKDEEPEGAPDLFE